MATVGSHAVNTFVGPVIAASGLVDANVVRGNDNTLRAAYNTHDADPSIHIQSGTLAARPATSADGSTYFATDTLDTYTMVSGVWVQWPSGPGTINVKSFGAVGNGVTDDTAAIQAAIDACAAAGGGSVYVPPGVYLLSIAKHPDSTSVATALTLKSNVWLCGAGSGATELKLGVVPNAVPTGCAASWQLHILSNSTPYSTTPKTNIRISDLTVNGNAANQTFVPPLSQVGVFSGRVRGGWVGRVVSKNVYGLTPGPPTETMHFDANGCTDFHYQDCEAYSDDGGDTATGFSSNVSTGVTWVGCVARNMKFGMGFTNWTSAHMRYVNCHAYNNGYAGFNTEISEYATYANCQSGGRGADTTLGVIGDQTPLPNQMGFKVLGSNYVSIIGGSSTYNTTSTGYGVYISAYAGPINSTYIHIDNFFCVANDVGVYADASQGPISLSPTVLVANNTTNFSGTGALNELSYTVPAPIFTLDAQNGTSGARWNARGGQDVHWYRFLKNGTEMLRLGYDGAIGLRDGITAPSVDVTGNAWLYIDTADGDLKIRFSDGTVKTIVTDT